MDMDFGKEKFDIILLAGQSNAEGSGVGPTKEEYLPDGKVFHMFGSRRLVGEKWVVEFPVEISIEETDSTKKDDLAVPFAHEYKSRGLLKEDRKLLIIDTGLGATAFLNGYWKPEDPGYKRMRYMLGCALNMNPENRVVAVIWHQGESDAVSNATYEEHYANLTRLFADMRKQAENEELPIIAADFCYQWKSTHEEMCAPVVKAIRDALTDVGGEFIETADLPSNHQDGTREGDYIHFSRNAVHILGRRYFDAYEKIISRKDRNV